MKIKQKSNIFCQCPFKLIAKKHELKLQQRYIQKILYLKHKFDVSLCGWINPVKFELKEFIHSWGSNPSKITQIQYHSCKSMKIAN
jgi:hypothetical protein